MQFHSKALALVCGVKYETLGGYNSDGRACDIITLTDYNGEEFMIEVQDSKNTARIEKYLDSIIQILKKDLENI